MDFLRFFVTNGGQLAGLAGGHIVLSLVSVAVAIVIALPIGAVVGHLHRFSFLAVNAGNVVRALPTLAIIAIAIALTLFGFVNIVIAMVVLAFPLILTNTYAAVDGIDPGMVEAARGMGMSGWEILVRVELPNAVPLTMTGIRTAWVYVVATAYLGAFAGATSNMGVIITNIESYGLSGVLAATVISVVIAFAGDLVLAGVQRVLTPAGLTLAAPAEAAA